MRTYAITCYIVALVAELGGVAFAVAQLRNNRAVLRRWRAANPEQGESSYGQLSQVGRVIDGLLAERRWREVVAISLIVVGIIAGTLGNFTGLPKA